MDISACCMYCLLSMTRAKSHTPLLFIDILLKFSIWLFFLLFCFVRDSRCLNLTILSGKIGFWFWFGDVHLLDKDFSKSVSSSRSDKRFARMKSNIKNRFVKFFAVRCYLLNARLVLQIPQSNATIMTYFQSKHINH